MGKGKFFQANRGKKFSAKNPPSHQDLRREVKQFVSADFLRNHVMFLGDTDSHAGKAPGMRRVDTSTAIIVDRKAAVNLIQLAATTTPIRDDEEHVFTSAMPFKIYVWNRGKAQAKEARIMYNVCKDDKTGKTILRHFHGIVQDEDDDDHVPVASRRELLESQDNEEYSSSSEDEFPADASVDLDYDE